MRPILFEDIAGELTDGYSLFHRITSKHDEHECFAWQTGIHDFAKWLDNNNYKVVQLPAIVIQLPVLFRKSNKDHES